VHPYLYYIKLGANPRRIADRLVWAVRYNDLTHWATIKESRRRKHVMKWSLLNLKFIEKSCPTFMDKVGWWHNWYEVLNRGCVQFWLHCPFVRFVFTSRFNILNPKVIVLNTGNLQRENSFLFKSCWEFRLELSILYSYYLFGHACQFCLVIHFNF
jgi:hypothetical protein